MDDFLDEFQGDKKKFDCDFGKDTKRRIAHMLEAYNPIEDSHLAINELDYSYLGIASDSQSDGLAGTIATDMANRSGSLPKRWVKRSMELLVYDMPNAHFGGPDYKDTGMESVKPVRAEAMIAADRICNSVIFKGALDNVVSVDEIKCLILVSDIYSKLSDEGKASVKETSPSGMLNETLSAFRMEKAPMYTGKNRLVIEFNEVIQDSLKLPWSEGEIDESLSRTKYAAKDVCDFMSSIAEAYKKSVTTPEPSPLTNEALTNIIYFRDSVIDNCPESSIALPKIEKTLYNYLGRGLKKSLVVEGDAGEGLGYQMNDPNAHITVKGSSGKKTGSGMKNGKLIIEGNAEIIEDMEGGEIWVSGNTYVEKSTMRGGKVFKNGKQIYPGWFSRMLKK